LRRAPPRQPIADLGKSISSAHAWPRRRGYATRLSRSRMRAARTRASAATLRESAAIPTWSRNRNGRHRSRAILEEACSHTQRSVSPEVPFLGSSRGQRPLWQGERTG
jgi:hypothetical protein